MGTGSHQVRRPLGYFRSWHSSRAASLASPARKIASALRGINMPTKTVAMASTLSVGSRRLDPFPIVASYRASIEAGPMTREELIKKLSENPRFKPAQKSGRAHVIPGAKPAEPAQQPAGWALPAPGYGR